MGRRGIGSNSATLRINLKASLQRLFCFVDLNMKTCMNFILFLSLLAASDPIFGERQDYGEIEYDSIDEASGIVSSGKNENVFWTHNDSGDENRIYAFNNLGQHLGIYYLDNCDARDWEDMAIGPGPEENQSYLYIGDIGDNYSQYNTKYIYRFLEPDIDSNQLPVSEVIYNVDIMEFQYEDGNRDAETLMIDSITKDIIVMSKREESVHIYQLPYPQSIGSPLTVQLIGIMDFYPEDSSDLGRIVSGDISSDGAEILIKSYLNIFHFPRYENQTITDAFNNTMTTVEYIMEPQGESVGWHPNAFGYFTLSEEAENVPCHLYFYPRIVGCMDENAINYNPYALEDDDSCIYNSSSGDLNDDNSIDVLDVIILVDYILNLADDELDGADINNDGNINILDVVQLVEIILN